MQRCSRTLFYLFSLLLAISTTGFAENAMNCDKQLTVVPTTVQIGAPPQGNNYRDIGKIYVDRYNDCGIKRQFGVISDLMKKATAAVGGTNVINLSMNNKYVIGEIIAPITSS